MKRLAGGGCNSPFPEAMKRAVVREPMKFAILIALLAAVPLLNADAADEKKPAAANAKTKKPVAKKPPTAKKPGVRTDMVDEGAIKLLKPFDKNSDDHIDIEELEEVAAEFKKNPTGPLAVLDRGKDGELDGLIDRAGMNVKLGASGNPAVAPGAKLKGKKPRKPRAPAKPKTLPATPS